MNLLELKDVVDTVLEHAGTCAEFASVKVEFKGTSYEIREITQFGIVPDVFIRIGKKESDQDCRLDEPLQEKS